MKIPRIKICVFRTIRILFFGKTAVILFEKEKKNKIFGFVRKKYDIFVR